ncbi:MAG: aldolase [Planctomycetota bacterium]|nr:MAG: aldolase [Planctomycetota bacterium]
MRFSRVKEKLRRGEPAFVVACHFADPSIYEMTSLMGFDGIWLDLEHHATSTETAATLMRAARVGVSDIIARCARWEYMRVGRLLEAGAQGIMYPRCESGEEAAEIARWSKFAPEGERGIDGANPDNPYCFAPAAEYIQLANEHTLLVVQIESPKAVDNAAEIAAVPGVDVLMLGPGDLSILSGVPFQFDHEVVQRAYRRVAEAAKNAGKWWGTVAFHPAHAKMLMDLGATFICHGVDILVLKNGFEEMQRQFSEIGFQFDNQLGADQTLGKKA